MISKRNILFNVIYKVVNEKELTCSSELTEALSVHRHHLLKLLINDPPNENDRNLVLKSSREAIQIPGIPQAVLLSQDHIQESIIISDMFKLNEITSVELIMSGEAESSSNPEDTRGLIAVLNYYYSQKTIVDALQILMKASFILNAESSLSSELVNMIDSYLDSLCEEGCLSHIIELIKNMNIEDEVKLLESQRALGSSKHRRQFFAVYNQIKRGLCECIMLRSYRYPLNLKCSEKLINLVREMYKDNINIKQEDVYQEDKIMKSVDKPLVYLTVSLINSLNPSIEGNNMNKYSKGDANYKAEIDKILKGNFEKTTDANIENKGIVPNTDNLLYMTWIISLQKLSYFKKEANLSQQYQRSSNFGDYEDFDDIVILDMDSQSISECFQYLISLINVDGFHEENIWIKCIHDLITDFIIYTPKMLKDLRTDSLRLPQNAVYFGSLMEVIGCLYGGESTLCESIELQSNPLLQTLAVEYWSPQEIMNYSDSSTLLAFEDNFRNWNVKSTDSYKQAVLFKFIRDSGDLVENPHLYISYVFMLKGLCVSDRTALYTYSFLNNNTITQQTPRLTWEWFSNSIYNHSKFLMSTPLKVHAMSSSELNGLLVVLQLIKRVIQHSDVVCTSMANNESLMLIQSLIMLLSCRVPEILKAELLNCLSCFCSHPILARSIWQSLESNNIISRASDANNCSILMELDQVEPKSQHYPITIAFLGLLRAQLPHIITESFFLDRSAAANYEHTLSQSLVVGGNQHIYSTLDGFTNIVHAVTEIVFIKHGMRSYKDQEEKFAVCEGFLSLCCKCLDLFIDQVENVKPTKAKLSWCQYDPGFFIVTQLLNDSPFFKTLINIIDCGYSQINDCLNNSASGAKIVPKSVKETLENSINCAMHLLCTMLEKEVFLVQLVREVNSKAINESSRFNMRSSRFRTAMPQEMSHLLMTSSPTNNFFPTLIKYIGMVDESERLCISSLRALTALIVLVNEHQHLLVTLTGASAAMRPCLVRCLDLTPIAFSSTQTSANILLPAHAPRTPRAMALSLILAALHQPAPNLGHHLLGLSCLNLSALRRSSLQEPGVGDCPKTCLHSLLSLVQGLSKEVLASPCLEAGDGDLSREAASLAGTMLDLAATLRILWMLASDPECSLAVLRFTRSNYQLIFNQSDLLACRTSKLAAYPELRALFWNQKSWLLKIAAIELRQCTANQQTSYVERLLRMLFGDDLMDPSEETVFSRIYNEERVFDGLMFDLLDDLEVGEQEEPADFGSCGRFKAEVLKEYLEHSVVEGPGGVRLLDPARLRRLLETDLGPEEDPGAPLHREVDRLCALAGSRGEVVLALGKVPLAEGWRQVVETAAVVGGPSIAARAALCLRQMLATLSSSPATPGQLLAPLSRACLVLAAVLAGLSVPEDSAPVSAQSSPPPLALDQVVLMVHLTADCVTKNNCQDQRTRVKFYGVLTYLVQMVLASPDAEAAMDACHSALASSGRSLYPGLCRDAVGGNVHLALSSLALLDCVAALDRGHGVLVPFLVDNGYLQHLISGLMRDCEQISKNLASVTPMSEAMDTGDHPQTESTQLYLYQSKMAVLTRLALCVPGARALVHHGVLGGLARYPRLLDRQDDGGLLSSAVSLASSLLATDPRQDTAREAAVLVRTALDALVAVLVSGTDLGVLVSHLLVQLARHRTLLEVTVAERLKAACVRALAALLVSGDRLGAREAALGANILAFLAALSHDDHLVFSDCTDGLTASRTNGDYSLQEVHRHLERGGRAPICLLVTALQTAVLWGQAQFPAEDTIVNHDNRHHNGDRGKHAPLALEACLALLWAHLSSWQARGGPIPPSSSSSAAYHPILRLQAASASSSSMANQDALMRSLAASLDDDLLDQACLCLSASLGHEEGASFARVLVHRLSRLLKLAS